MMAGAQLSNIGFGESFIDPTRVLRRDLLAEEMSEYVDAEINDDLVEVLDGLADIIVIALGSMYAYVGRTVATEILDEVARSNLSKVVDGRVLKNDAGKIVKPRGWTAPDIAGILKAGIQ